MIDYWPEIHYKIYKTHIRIIHTNVYILIIKFYDYVCDACYKKMHIIIEYINT